MVFLKFALVAALFLMVPRISRWFAMRLRPDPAPLAATTEAVELPTAPGQTNLAGILEVIRAKYKIPCLAAAVLEGDQLVARGITGVRKAGSSERATLNDQFHLGSDTKAMTATLVAELIEEGKLDWSTTIGQIFGGSVKDMDPAWRTVTVEQLLTHRGGAPTNLNEGGLWSRLWERKGTPTEQRMELVKGVLSRAGHEIHLFKCRLRHCGRNGREDHRTAVGRTDARKAVQTARHYQWRVRRAWKGWCG